MPIPDQFIQIDEEGFPLSQERRLTDPRVGHEIFSQLKVHASGSLVSSFGGVPVLVEAFDEPYIAQRINKTAQHWSLLLPYDVEIDFKLNTLSLDEWDRFHGYTITGVPFVMSRAAQAGFFDLLEEFDDESISSDGETYNIPNYWSQKSEIEKSQFWNQVYLKNENPGWNLGEPAPALQDMLPRLKLAKCRVLVVGCGEGHDAARFAQDGHIVTAVDFSEEALARAKKLYGHLHNIQFLHEDVFNLPQRFAQSFDIVFEHTCYCAISPHRRKDLVKAWSQLLTDQGQLMGVFFTFEKRQGPPFGGSEWELRQRLQNSFQPIFWGRWQKSVPARQGKELFIFMQKRAK